MCLEDRYFLKFAAAFVRGRARMGDRIDLGEELTGRLLDDLEPPELESIVEAGIAAGLKLHKFKRTGPLPRVRRVLGVLRGIDSAALLDIGSGRGVFLWPLLEAFPYLNITATDEDERRASDLHALHLGGLHRLAARQADACDLPFESRAFDVVTVLEVLEHIPTAQEALAEVVRVADRFVLLSVPSKPDDNPEHVHLFTEARIRSMFAKLACERVSADYVHGHMIVVANVAG